MIINFNALDALAEVAVGEGWEERVGGGVRVAMADKWGKSRYVFSLSLSTLISPSGWATSSSQHDISVKSRVQADQSTAQTPLLSSLTSHSPPPPSSHTTGHTPVPTPEQSLVQAYAYPNPPIHPRTQLILQTFELSTSQIPMTLLARQDPILDQILFYEDVPLFEDELHDNGESILNARIVRPSFQ